MRRRAAAPIALACAALAGGCGNDPAVLPPAAQLPAKETEVANAPLAGLSLRLPVNFRREPREPPGVYRASFLDSFVATYAYPREEPLPERKPALEDARRRLVQAAKDRDESYRSRSSRTLEVDGAPAVELVGTQRVSRERLRVRSLHVYKGKVEYVIELGSPVRTFDDVDSRAWPEIERSLKVTGKLRGVQAGKEDEPAEQDEPAGG